MSERSSGGPVLRKRGARKREDGSEDDKGPAAEPRGDGAPAPAESRPTVPAGRLGAPRPHDDRAGGPQHDDRRRPPGRHDGGAAAGRDVRRATGGPSRRLYDPRQDNGDAAVRASVDGDPARAGAKDINAGWRKDAAKKLRPGKRQLTKEKEELRAVAMQLAKDKGVPIVHAYRILKGQATLNDVLKGMMRKERFEQLVIREGIDRELAGQVASGHLSKKRAQILTRMRVLRGPKLHVDGVAAAHGSKELYAVNFFVDGWKVGYVKVARPYDFDFLEEGSVELHTRFKHDVKAICPAADLPAVKESMTTDDVVKSQGLGGTEQRAERVRPDDEWMLKLVAGGRVVRFTMRDGDGYVGQLRAFGRWDADLVLPGGEVVTVFFHGLHPVAHTLGLNE